MQIIVKLYFLEIFSNKNEIVESKINKTKNLHTNYKGFFFIIVEKEYQN